MSATVEQIAEVLTAHQPNGHSGVERKPFRCRCGLAYPAGALPRHQAEQVAALGVDAGEVKWGVKHAEAGWDGSDLDTWDVRGTPYDKATALADAAKRRGSHAVQRTVGPWVEVTDEGGEGA